jgi:hypothetical protein
MIQSIKLIENDAINSVKQWAKGKLFLIEIIIIMLLINIFKKREEILSMYCKLIKKNRFPKVKLIKNGSII